MKISIASLCILFAFSVNAQTAKFESARLSPTSYTVGSVATDASGNVYSIGSFTGEQWVFNGKEKIMLTRFGQSDVFITKYDAAGKFLWVKCFGGKFYDLGQSIALDTKGNVFITGSHKGTVDFDPGSGVFNLGSGDHPNAFISKFDTDGNFIWAKTMGGDGNTYGKSLTVDLSGNIYTVGTFSYTTDFDPGEAVSNLTSSVIDRDSKIDMFVQKLDAAGNFVWAKAWWGGVSDESHSVAVDGSGNVYTTGYFYGKIDFDPGDKKFYLISKGKKDIFISKIDVSGNFVWAKSIGGILDDEGTSLDTDASGNIYVTGYFSETVDFDPGKEKLEFTAPGSYGEDEKKDIFITKFNSSGIFLWALQIGGDHSDIGKDISVDASNTILVEGDYYGNIDFDPGSGTFFVKPETAGYYGKASFELKLSQK